MNLKLLVLALVLIHSATSSFHPDLARFIKQRYGADTLRRLTRADLGSHNQGSFGGGKSRSNRRPVVFVHGLRAMAGSLYKQREIFAAHGFPASRLLATTYGPGENNKINLIVDTVKCEYIKQVRTMLKVAIEYYHSDIDVVALSMGAPIARKAILGGKCVDTGENLGPSLNKRIGTFLSVGGSNRGSTNCILPIPGVCNHVNGLNCNSNFIKDVNAQNKPYIGKRRHSIYSPTDEITGYISPCGGTIHSFKGVSEHKVNNKLHTQVLYKTIPQQVDIIEQPYRRRRKL